MTCESEAARDGRLRILRPCWGVILAGGERSGSEGFGEGASFVEVKTGCETVSDWAGVSAGDERVARDQHPCPYREAMGVSRRALAKV